MRYPERALVRVGREIHVFHAAGDKDVAVAGADGRAASITAFSPEPQTLLIVTAPTGQAALDRCLARRRLPFPRLNDVAHDYFVDQCAVDSGPLDAALMATAPSSGAGMRSRRLETSQSACERR